MHLEFEYTGESCLDGSCALCNEEHPDHEKAVQFVKELFAPDE